MKENTGEKTTFRSTRFQTFSAQKKMLHVFSRRRSASPERKSGRRGSTGADEVVDLETFYSDDWFRSVVPMLTGIAQAAPLKNWAADRGVGGLKWVVTFKSRFWCRRERALQCLLQGSYISQLHYLDSVFTALKKEHYKSGMQYFVLSVVFTTRHWLGGVNEIKINFLFRTSLEPMPLFVISFQRVMYKAIIEV